MIKYLLLIFLFLPQIVNAGMIIRGSGGTPPAGGSIDEDFSGTLGDWTTQSGTWNLDTVNDNLDSPTSAAGLITHDTDLGGTEQWILVQYVSIGSFSFTGPYFRFTGNTADTAYAVRYEIQNTDLVWRYCTGASCTTIQTVNHTLNFGDYLGVRVTGTGTSTQVEIWDHGGTSPGAYSTVAWGTADHILTNNPASAADTGQYVGLYDGASSGNSTFDNILAGAD